MNNEIKDIDIDTTDVKQNKNKDTKKIDKSSILKYITYIVLFILALILKNSTGASNFVLGDFGSIVPLLLQTVALMGLKWLPIFCVAGVVLTKFEKTFKDFSNSFLTVVIIVAVTSIGLLLIL